MEMGNDKANWKRNGKVKCDREIGKRNEIWKQERGNGKNK